MASATTASATSGPAGGEGAAAATPRRTPVYFISHGGPNIMYDVDHPVFARLVGLGREITQTVRPRAVVVFSAHWQSDTPDAVEVNVAETEPLIYDFYGFPRHYYAAKFPTHGSPQLAHRVMALLGENGIKTAAVERGLDHGVWAPFRVLFDPATNPLTVPVVQVSLWGREKEIDAGAHIRLGRALAPLRDDGVLIIVSGMAVHNLRHMAYLSAKFGPLPYATSFDHALKDAVETEPGEGRDEAMVRLLDRPDARQAHPTFEHLLPIHVGVGAAGPDPGVQLWTLPEGPFSWAQYRFGPVGA